MSSDHDSLSSYHDSTSSDRESLFFVFRSMTPHLKFGLPREVLERTVRQLVTANRRIVTTASRLQLGDMDLEAACSATVSSNRRFVAPLRRDETTERDLEAVEPDHMSYDHAKLGGAPIIESARHLSTPAAQVSLTPNGASLRAALDSTSAHFRGLACDSRRRSLKLASMYARAD